MGATVDPISFMCGRRIRGGNVHSGRIIWFVYPARMWEMYALSLFYFYLYKRMSQAKNEASKEANEKKSACHGIILSRTHTHTQTPSPMAYTTAYRPINTVYVQRNNHISTCVLCPFVFAPLHSSAAYHASSPRARQMYIYFSFSSVFTVYYYT